MGCASSKRIKASVDDGYRPAPASFAVFNVNAVQEPWLAVDQAPEEHQEKASHMPAPILEKLSTFESDAPHSWDEVSRVLHLDDLKKPQPLATSPKPAVEPLDSTSTKKIAPRKSPSFRTVDELDARLSSASAKPETQSLYASAYNSTDAKKNTTRKSLSFVATLAKSESERRRPSPERNRPRKSLSNHLPELKRTESEDFKPKPLRDNIFIVKDRLERQKQGLKDPLSEFPEKCPPDGGADAVVLYTTSLRGVRRTHEDCTRARAVLEGQGVVFEERDVSLHGKYLKELKELLEEESLSLPRVFVKGKYVGGVEELVELNETARLGRILGVARVERGVVRQACGACGGKRFVPCLECGGSCKVVKSGLEKERCGQCNENGLVLCPACK